MDPGKCEGCGERNQDLEGISAPHPPFSPRNKRTGSGLSEDHQSPVEVLPSASQPGQGWGFTKGGAGRGLKKNRWRCCTVWSRLVREGAEERRELAHQEKWRASLSCDFGTWACLSGDTLSQHILHNRSEGPGRAVSTQFIVEADVKQAGESTAQKSELPTSSLHSHSLYILPWKTRHVPFKYSTAVLYNDKDSHKHFLLFKVCSLYSRNFFIC